LKNLKKALFAFAVILLLGIGGIFAALKQPRIKPDSAAVNDALMNGEDAAEIIMRESEKLNAETTAAYSKLRIFLCVYLGLVAVSGIGFYLYCEYGVLRPFRELNRFTRNIAAGDLDFPLPMDRHGAFGVFMESFDIMREELKKARENERAAERSKKELVAQLSHDIKTPVASIKATAELMLISANDANKTRLQMINAKADQINTLITDMFHATLEELQQLTVTVAEINSFDIANCVKTADYKGRVKPFAVPDCIVMADKTRLQQIFDNIIGNCYKYSDADSDIELRAYFDNNMLIVEIADFGCGVEPDELPLITNKYYRGKNAVEQSGYGLGLYISKYFSEQMGGGLICENNENGFTVKVILKLA